MNSPREESISISDFAERLQKYRPHVQALNIETQKQRFPRYSEYQEPPMAAWRCNLAAFSQRRNLLFTAQAEDIYVWIPRGSHQLLGSEPEMIIHPVLNQPLAGGYILPSRPHVINHIIVDDLGVDEVLLLATDSGNVTGYNVEAIFSAIKHGVEFEHTRPFDGGAVKPFFAEYVSQSAWGLATHKFARLIAVSSNTGIITVFAFAMVDEQPEDESDLGASQTSYVEESGELGQNWVSIVNKEQMDKLKEQRPFHRTRNLRINYVGHCLNIPCVSFANFDLDPNGVWMVSTDIGNAVLVWKIWESIDHLQSPIEGGTGGTMGWFVLPIDPRRVQRHSSKLDACGGELDRTDLDCEILKAPGMANGKLDRSQTICEVSTPLEPLPDDAFSPDCRVYPRPMRRLSSETSPTGPSLRRPGSANVQYPHPECSSEAEHATDSVMSDISSLRVTEGISDLIEEAQGHLDPTVGVDPSSKLEDTRLRLEECNPLHPRNPRFFPVLQFTDRDITLTSYPCDSAFCISAASPFAEAFNFEGPNRMNMIKYIPELGIVVVASQIGRVAIITLTWHAEIGHSFRIDWILPLSSQKTETRFPLVGMAVSPMPGFEIPQDVPCVPQNFNIHEWLEFDYRLLNPENDVLDIPSSQPSSPNPFTANPNQPESPTAGQNDSDPLRNPSKGGRYIDLEKLDIQTNHPLVTRPELHSLASGMYQPHEKWHGWHPGRHYRLLLIFYDQTVMSYEFWHTWKR